MALAETLPIENEAGKEAEQYEAQTKDLLVAANSITIATPQDYEAANDELKRIKTKAKELEDKRKSLTRPLDESKKRILELFRPALTFLADAEKHIKRQMIDFTNDQERLRRAEEARIREQQRKEQEKLRKQAEKAAAAGKAEKAEALQEQAESMPPAFVPPATPKTSSSIRKVWKARVKDKDALIKAAAKRSDLQALLDVNETALGGMARALKSNLAIPGVEAYEEQIVSTRV